MKGDLEAQTQSGVSVAIFAWSRASLVNASSHTSCGIALKSGIKILIVDDETDTRELVAFVLEQQVAQVTTATP